MAPDSPWVALLYGAGRGFRLLRRLRFRFFGVECARCHALTYEPCERCWDD